MPVHEGGAQDQVGDAVRHGRRGQGLDGQGGRHELAVARRPGAGGPVPPGPDRSCERAVKGRATGSAGAGPPGPRGRRSRRERRHVVRSVRVDAGEPACRRAAARRPVRRARAPRRRRRGPSRPPATGADVGDLLGEVQGQLGLADVERRPAHVEGRVQRRARRSSSQLPVPVASEQAVVALGREDGGGQPERGADEGGAGGWRTRSGPSASCPGPGPATPRTRCSAACWSGPSPARRGAPGALAGQPRAPSSHRVHEGQGTSPPGRPFPRRVPRGVGGAGREQASSRSPGCSAREEVRRGGMELGFRRRSASSHAGDRR